MNPDTDLDWVVATSGLLANAETYVHMTRTIHWTPAQYTLALTDVVALYEQRTARLRVDATRMLSSLGKAALLMTRSAQIGHRHPRRRSE